MDCGEAAGKCLEQCDDVRGGGLRVGICGAVIMCKGGCAFDDAFAGSGMGAASHPAERDCSGTVSDRGSLVAVDAIDRNAGESQEASSDGAFWPTRGVG